MSERLEERWNADNYNPLAQPNAGGRNRTNLSQTLMPAPSIVKKKKT